MTLEEIIAEMERINQEAEAYLERTKEFERDNMHGTRVQQAKSA